MKYPQDMVIEEITENKEAFIELLLIADPSVDMINKYLSKGHLFTMQVKKEIVCAAVVVSDGSTAEIKNLVTHPDHLRKGYASRMISFIFNYFKEIPEIIVGTGSTGIPEREFYQLAFYRKCGFVDSHIIRNFFVDNYPEPIFEDNSEQCIDMIYLKYLPNEKD
ncbi:GNAT family N-acetyltransferase [Bacteroides nordii]|uniref:GNAT family N-acetyltransferase n=1 Tax=Bacteroides nordii TaxID=291645 RepID=UPI00399B8F30